MPQNPSLKEFVREYTEELKKALDNLDYSRVEQAFALLMQTYQEGRKVFIFGNGGSAVNASHMACDLGKGTLARAYDLKERRLKVVSLTDNVALLTAFANDLSFEDIFVQQLRSLVEEGDLVIALSGSGGSPNVNKAVEYAKKQGARTIGISGFGEGGKLAQIVDCPLAVKSNQYGPLEDVQLALNHILVSWFARMKKDQEGISTSKNAAIPFRGSRYPW